MYVQTCYTKQYVHSYICVYIAQYFFCFIRINLRRDLNTSGIFRLSVRQTNRRNPQFQLATGQTFPTSYHSSSPSDDAMCTSGLHNGEICESAVSSDKNRSNRNVISGFCTAPFHPLFRRIARPQSLSSHL